MNMKATNELTPGALVKLINNNSVEQSECWVRNIPAVKTRYQPVK